MGEASDRVAEVEAAVRALTRKRAGLIKPRDVETMVPAFYAADAVLLPSGEPAVEGREAILAFWREVWERGLVSLNLESERVAGGPDLAYEVGHFTRTLRPLHGAPFQDHGKYLVVYARQDDGSLRAVAEMFNSDDRG